MLHELMQELDVTPEQVLMVGDTSHDRRWPSSRRARPGVTYGAHT